MQVEKVVASAHQVALKARTHSHSPYSKFAVGAAVKIAGQTEAIGGCNVENASYGGTICAERTALVQAQARFGAFKPEFLVVVTADSKPTPPCGLCLQVIAEFASDDMPIYLGNEKEILAKYTLKELLPKAFRSFDGARK